MPILVKNPRAFFDYEILETFEAGLVLAGHEVKAIKKGHMSLRGSYVILKNQEAFLMNAHISAYQPKNMPADYEPTGTRKLLLHKKEIKSLIGKIKQKGLTLVPMRVYTKHRRIKLQFGLGRGKRLHDKRDAIAKREFLRRKDRALKDRG